MACTELCFGNTAFCHTYTGKLWVTFEEPYLCLLRAELAELMRIFSCVTFPSGKSPLWDTLTLIESSENPTKSDSPRPPHIFSVARSQTFLPTTVFLRLCPQPLLLHKDAGNLFSPGSSPGFPDSSVCLNGSSMSLHRLFCLLRSLPNSVLNSHSHATNTSPVAFISFEENKFIF